MEQTISKTNCSEYENLINTAPNHWPIFKCDFALTYKYTNSISGNSIPLEIIKPTNVSDAERLLR